MGAVVSGGGTGRRLGGDRCAIWGFEGCRQGLSPRPAAGAPVEFMSDTRHSGKSPANTNGKPQIGDLLVSKTSTILSAICLLYSLSSYSQNITMPEYTGPCNEECQKTMDSLKGYMQQERQKLEELQRQVRESTDNTKQSRCDRLKTKLEDNLTRMNALLAEKASFDQVETQKCKEQSREVKRKAIDAAKRCSEMDSSDNFRATMDRISCTNEAGVLQEGSKSALSACLASLEYRKAKFPYQESKLRKESQRLLSQISRCDPSFDVTVAIPAQEQ